MMSIGLTWLCCAIALVFAFLLHIALGAKSIPLPEVLQALLYYDEGTFNHIIVWDLRCPRALMAAVVGANLAVAGALMQGVTRNPLAEPSILGLMHGASFAVVVAMSFWGITSAGWIPLLAALGALAAALLVWSVASAAPGGASPITLILAGAAITAFLSAIVSAIHLIDEESYENLRVWLTGSLSGRDLQVLWWCSPWIIAGLGVSLVVARQVTTFAMGNETAAGLGINIGRLKALVLFAVIALTASSVALVGPMGFVGLVIPHVVRLFIGYDYRLIIPYSAIVGSIYLLIVDTIARIVLSPIEVSTGIVTAIIGAPLFVWLVRKKL